MSDDRHPAQRHFSQRGSELCLADKPVSHWLTQAGATPAYLYDATVVQQQIQQLRRHLPAGMRLNYAIKANPFPPLVQAISQWLDGFDVASGRELALALQQPLPAEHISFAGPGKSPEALRLAIDAGATINLESATELQRCLTLGRELGRRPRVCIRVNPGLDVRASGMKMSSTSGSPFGIDYDQVPALLQNWPTDELELLGLHVFGCSQQLNADLLLDYLAAVLERLQPLAAAFPVPLRQLNLGGGFGIPYFPNERPLDLAAVGSGLAHLLERHADWLQGVDLGMEFGRYIVGEAGIYLCRVVDLKQSAGKTFAIVDGGMHHHLANAGLLGQVVRRNHPVAVANKADRPATASVTICGPLCTPLDRVATDILLPELDIGDLIAVFSSGAYGLSASPTGFLSHPAAEELLCQA